LLSLEVFDRIVSYAMQTYAAISDHLLPLRSTFPPGASLAPECDLNKFLYAKKNWESLLFTTAHDDYDVLIHLEPSACPQYAEKTKAGKPSGSVIFKQQEFFQSLRLNEISQKSGNAGCMGYLIGFDPAEELFQTLKVGVSLFSLITYLCILESDSFLEFFIIIIILFYFFEIIYSILRYRNAWPLWAQFITANTAKLSALFGTRERFSFAPIRFCLAATVRPLASAHWSIRTSCCIACQY
jgi:hypothetical protein